ncbi:MAG: glycosyltransferase, partial [Alloprevotella tannerae]|nr:glycosyltransferase [Alloprevotella tannerae]
LLYVGKRTSYKNFAAMLPALQHFFREHPDWRMVCTLVPFTKKELAAFSALGLAQHFVFARPDDAELLALYRDAQAFIFPSLYEGFGIPILEAYQMDCPVLLNRKSCFPEVVGEAALYFNLDETQDNLLDCLQTLAAMSTTAKEELLCKQRERLKIYAWQKAGNALHDVYLKVKAQGGRAKR